MKNWSRSQEDQITLKHPNCAGEIIRPFGLDIIRDKKTTVQHIMDLIPEITNPDKIRAWDWINIPYPDF